MTHKMPRIGSNLVFSIPSLSSLCRQKNVTNNITENRIISVQKYLCIVLVLYFHQTFFLLKLFLPLPF